VTTRSNHRVLVDARPNLAGDVRRRPAAIRGIAPSTGIRILLPDAGDPADRVVVGALRLRRAPLLSRSLLRKVFRVWKEPHATLEIIRVGGGGGVYQERGAVTRWRRESARSSPHVLASLYVVPDSGAAGDGYGARYGELQVGLISKRKRRLYPTANGSGRSTKCRDAARVGEFTACPDPR
jgi:hypothetical protein